jgi:hypothetical protein
LKNIGLNVIAHGGKAFNEKVLKIMTLINVFQYVPQTKKVFNCKSKCIKFLLHLAEVVDEKKCVLSNEKN